jgi:GlpG protein
MRLICTISSENRDLDPYLFSAFLKSRDIDNECEAVSLPDKPLIYRLWVVEEEKTKMAMELYREYENNPQDPYFHSKPAQPPAKEGSKKNLSSKTLPSKKMRLLSPAPHRFITTFIVILCAILYFWSALQKGVQNPPPLKGIAEAPIFPPVDRPLVYDYPHYFELRDKLLKIYPLKDIKAKAPPPEEAKEIYAQMQKTPFWIGLYDMIVNTAQKKAPFSYSGPLFEKISQGQVWRIFTPALMHFNFLHILFNLLWFILLGNQIEFRIGAPRYLILIFFTAIISNTAQYLMTGSFFLGLSGVVVGQVGFIWARQQKAPWEGYLLNKMTSIFLALFILGMFALSFIFFITQIAGVYKGNVSIANTAHIAGGIVGYLLGRMGLFSLKKI